MAAKTTPKLKHKKSKPGPAPAHAASMISIATQNLISTAAAGEEFRLGSFEMGESPSVTEK